MNAVKIHHSCKIYEPISMIPARGWCMVYACDDERRYALVRDLVAFVLARIRYTDVYENGTETTHKETRIVGYVAGDNLIYPAEEADNFIGYKAPGVKTPDHMEQRAREYVLAHKSTIIQEKEPIDESPWRRSIRADWRSGHQHGLSDRD